MSVAYHRGGWEVRWRDASGRRRAKRFGEDESAARAFDEALGDVKTSERQGERAEYGQSGGVYPYETTDGTRWRYFVNGPGEKQITKRGFTSATAARNARQKVIERLNRGEIRRTKHTFGTWWNVWLPSRKPYLEENSWRAYDVDGRWRLLPELAEVPLERLDTARVRAAMETWAEAVAEEEVAAKTINNTLGTLVVCLNEAVKEKLIPSNPALGIQRFPPAHVERDYLRLHEITIYLDACHEVYRPVAETLIGAGPRISEAIGLNIQDLELEESGGIIVIYRSGKRKKGRAVTGATKQKKFHNVEIGPNLSRVLQRQVDYRATMPFGDQPTAPLFVMPVRVAKRSRGRWASTGTPERLDRNTVSNGWHKDALADAGLRDMPLHSLRHTAAAAWLASGNSLAYVQHQLDHSDIETTRRYYGHLERHVLAAGAQKTEQAIVQAAERHKSKLTKRAA